MAFFNYSAFDSRGLKKKGIIEALTLEEAQRQIVEQDLFLTEIKQTVKKRNIPTKKELAVFTEELFKLLQASLPLYEALIFLKEKYRLTANFFFVAHLAEEIKKGKMLSEALRSFSEKIDFLYVSMIESGERGSHLDRSLQELFVLLNKELKLKKQLVSALSYPAFLLGFCFLVLSILLFFVLPSLFDLFEGKRLHPLTQIMFSLSYFLNQHKSACLSILVILLTGIGLLFIKEIRYKLVKTRVISFWIKRGFLKEFFLQSALVRFARTLSLLLFSGVSYLDALKLSKKVARFAVLEEEIEKAEEAVMQGKRLSEAFAGSTTIPVLMQRMMQLAEESADMPAMIGKTAEIMEDELAKKIQKINTFLGPMLLLLLGVLVGLVVLSVLIPLTDIGAFIN